MAKKWLQLQFAITLLVLQKLCVSDLTYTLCCDEFMVSFHVTLNKTFIQLGQFIFTRPLSLLGSMSNVFGLTSCQPIGVQFYIKLHPSLVKTMAIVTFTAYFRLGNTRASICRKCTTNNHVASCDESTNPRTHKKEQVTI